MDKTLYECLVNNIKIKHKIAAKACKKIYNDADVIVETCIIIDGGLCTASYGKRYAALSDCGVVIGLHLKFQKVIF